MCDEQPHSGRQPPAALSPIPEAEREAPENSHAARRDNETSEQNATVANPDLAHYRVRLLDLLIAARQCDTISEPSAAEANPNPLSCEPRTQTSGQIGHPTANHLIATSPQSPKQLPRDSRPSNANHVPDISEVPNCPQENPSLPSNSSEARNGARNLSAANPVVEDLAQQESLNQQSRQVSDAEIIPEHENTIVSFFSQYALNIMIKAIWTHPGAGEAETRLRNHIDYVLNQRAQGIITVPQLLHSIAVQARSNCEAASCLDVLGYFNVLDDREFELDKQRQNLRAEHQNRM